jgi:hypothetical protein
MANERVRQIYQYMGVSGVGKQQSALGVYMPNADLDTRDACTVTVSDNVNRGTQYDCDGVDLTGEPIFDRDTIISLDYAQAGFTPQILARWLAYSQGVAAAPTGTTANEVQTLTRNGTVSGGTFTLTLVHEGKTGVTEPIAYDATNPQILAALLKKTGTATAMGKLLRSGDVVITGTWGTAITATFGGRLAGANMALFTVGNGSITGGGTVDAAQGTAGDQKIHAISRSTDGTLPLFSIITGDKNGGYDHMKYGDAVVNSIRLNGEQGAGNLVGMTVEIFCNYTAEREASYSVPTCVNITPVKVEDLRVKIAGTWETPDVFNIALDINNVIPREAAFAFDDIDISNAYQRGDRPTQGFTASIFGSPDTTLYQTAEAEETSGNDVEFILHVGQAGNRVSFTGADTKIKFQNSRMGFAGALNQSVINIVGTPYNTPPLTYSAVVSQTATFLTASS